MSAVLKNNISNYLETIGKLETLYPTKLEQGFLQLRSMKNFLIHYNEVDKKIDTQIIDDLIAEYFEIVLKQDYIVNNALANKIAFTYTNKIGNVYKKNIGFKFYPNTPFIPLVQGLIIDIVLYVFIVRVFSFFTPIFAVIMLSYWSYLRFFFVSKNKVYGPRY